MAATAKERRHYKHVLVFSLLFTASIFLSFSLYKTSSLSTRHRQSITVRSPCNYSDGKWIYDNSIRSPRYDSSCKEIYKGWNCIAGDKSNAFDIYKWRWKPNRCDLPQFDPQTFLQAYRDTSIGFVGDSLNRNMFVSLFCTLKQVSGEVKKWRPAGADRGFTFLKYNLTVAYHRTNLLASYSRWTANANDRKLVALGYKQGYRIDADIPERTWAEAPSFHDILIFNTGHWWCSPSKFDPAKFPMLFFEKDLPLIPPVSLDVGLDLVLKHMVLRHWFLNGNL